MTKKKAAKDGEKTRKSGKKKVRDAAIIARAAEGAKGRELAAEFGLCEQTISTILNSPDAKRKAEAIDKALEVGIAAAMKTVLDHVKFDYDAARDLLQNFGSMSSKKKLEVTVPPPPAGGEGSPKAATGEVITERKLSIEERIALLKGET